jgi:WXG100 family type VII secretion target
MASVDGTQIVVPADLEAAGQYMNQQASIMADELQTLAQQLQPLQGTWTGQAATYFEGLQNEWNIAAAGLFGPDGVLGLIAQAMNVNWGNYSQAEADNVQTWTPSN